MSIRIMQLRVGTVHVIFANGNFFDNIYLWFRGYRRHETLLGSVMAKWWKKK